MDQHTPELPAIDLPTPQQTENANYEGAMSAHEAVAASAMEQPGSVATMPSTQQMTNPAVPAPQVPPAPPSHVSNDPTMPPIADDIDLIEKDWIIKAKQIVEQTKHDPYIQNKEMTKVKAEYLKKRYNKEVKSGD